MHLSQGRCTERTAPPQKRPDLSECPLRWGPAPGTPAQLRATFSTGVSVAMLREGHPLGMQRGTWEAARPQVPGLTAPAGPGLALHLLPAGPAPAWLRSPDRRHGLALPDTAPALRPSSRPVSPRVQQAGLGRRPRQPRAGMLPGTAAPSPQQPRLLRSPQPSSPLPPAPSAPPAPLIPQPSSRGTTIHRQSGSDRCLSPGAVLGHPGAGPEALTYPRAAAAPDRWRLAGGRKEAAVNVQGLRQTGFI